MKKDWCVANLYLFLIKYYLGKFPLIGFETLFDSKSSNRCTWIYHIYLSQWHVICWRVGTKLFYIEMEHAPAGMSAILCLLSYMSVFSPFSVIIFFCFCWISTASVSLCFCLPLFSAYNCDSAMNTRVYCHSIQV